MLAAAAAWDDLAAELGSTAASYASEVSALTSGAWQGPSSASMAAAAAPYVAWMNATAAQAKETGSQAKVAAAASVPSTIAGPVPLPLPLGASICTGLRGAPGTAVAVGAGGWYLGFESPCAALGGGVGVDEKR